MQQFILIIIISLSVNQFEQTLSQSPVYRNHLIFKRRVCSQSQGKCGSLCFDTKVYTCHNLHGKKPFMCHKEDSVCGDSCYDPSEKTCYGSGEDAVPCHWGFRFCPSTGQCYDPKSDTSHSSCSSNSYYSSSNNWDSRQPSFKDFKQFNNWDGNQQHSKPNWNNGNSNRNNPGSNTMAHVEPKPSPSYISSACGMGNKVCGGVCYDPKKQQCFGEQEGPPRLSYLVCPKNNKRCGNSCYDPSLSRCSIEGGDHSSNSNSGNHNFCSYGQMPCGSKCIDPNEESCNNEDSSNSKWNKESSGGSWNSPNSQKSSWNSNNDNNGCGSGLSKCGANCYDPFKQACLGNNESDRLICESGQEACGKKCYDPFNQRCINIGSGGNSGGTNDGGGSLYFSGGSGAAWGKNSFSNGGSLKKLLICRWNESACGAKCYDPQKEKCNGNSVGSNTNDF